MVQNETKRSKRAKNSHLETFEQDYERAMGKDHNPGANKSSVCVYGDWSHLYWAPVYTVQYIDTPVGVTQEKEQVR